MSKCNVCSASITNRQLKVVCSECKGLCHANCVSMSREDIDTLAAGNIVWRCPPCAVTRRQSMSAVSRAESGQATISDVVFMLEQARDERKRLETDLGTSIEHCHSKIIDNTNMIAEQTAQIAECLKTIATVRQENLELKKQVNDLTTRLAEAEQYSRRNCVEIYGVPEVENENVLQMVKQVGSAVKFTIEDGMVDACHRLGKNKSKKGGPPGIIVKFVRRFDKQRLLELKKLNKPELSARHIGMASDSPIYVNESLCFARRDLLKTVQEFKRKHGYKYAWVKEGKIFLKKEDKGKAIPVTHPDDLAKL